MCALRAQSTERRYDQVIVKGAKENVAAKQEQGGGAGGMGIDTDGAAQAAGQGIGQAKQAVGQVCGSCQVPSWAQLETVFQS